MKLIDRLKAGDGTVAVVGLGYVGYPLAESLSELYNTVGFDVNPDKVEQLKVGAPESLLVTSNEADLADAICFIVAVPTPVDESNAPKLDHVTAATTLVARYMKPGGLVVYESTVYPGCTEELCQPILEELSGMKAGPDFKIGYSPERVSPGDTGKDLPHLVKVVSACDEEALEDVAALYEPIVQSICKAPSMRVAEAAKLVENVQRDVNISLVNELAIIFDKMNIDTHEVLNVASTKWNFQKFYPGLVGGHCISVDPHYLVYKSRQNGHTPRVIMSGRSINDQMPGFIAEKLVKKLIAIDRNPGESKVLVMGVTFKANIDDIRNSKVFNFIESLNSFSVEVDAIDPHADPEEVLKMYGVSLAVGAEGKYDAIVLAVGHEEYIECETSFFERHLDAGSIFIDISGKRRDLDGQYEYWRL